MAAAALSASYHSTTTSTINDAELQSQFDGSSESWITHQIVSLDVHVKIQDEFSSRTVDSTMHHVPVSDVIMSTMPPQQFTKYITLAGRKSVLLIALRIERETKLSADHEELCWDCLLKGSLSSSIPVWLW